MSITPIPCLPSRPDLEQYVPHLLAGMAVIGNTNAKVTVEDFGGLTQDLQICIDAQVYIRAYIGQADGQPKLLWAVDAVRYSPAAAHGSADYDVALVAEGLRGGYAAMRTALKCYTDDLLDRASEAIGSGLDLADHKKLVPSLGALAA